MKVVKCICDYEMLSICLISMDVRVNISVEFRRCRVKLVVFIG